MLKLVESRKKKSAVLSPEMNMVVARISINKIIKNLLIIFDVSNKITKNITAIGINLETKLPKINSFPKKLLTLTGSCWVHPKIFIP